MPEMYSSCGFTFLYVLLYSVDTVVVESGESCISGEIEGVSCKSGRNGLSARVLVFPVQ